MEPRMRRSRRLGLAALPLLLLSPFARAGVQLVVDGVDDTLKAPVIAGVLACSWWWTGWTTRSRLR